MPPPCLDISLRKPFSSPPTSPSCSSLPLSGSFSFSPPLTATPCPFSVRKSLCMFPFPSTYDFPLRVTFISDSESSPPSKNIEEFFFFLTSPADLCLRPLHLGLISLFPCPITPDSVGLARNSCLVGPFPFPRASRSPRTSFVIGSSLPFLHFGRMEFFNHILFFSSLD